MNYREEFRGASSLGDALDIYQNVMDGVAATQAAVLGQIVTVHETTLENEGVDNAERTDVTLELTAFRVLGQLQPMATRVLSIVTDASQALTARMNSGDRELFRHGVRLVDQGAGSPSFVKFVQQALADDKPALVAALDKPVADQLHKQADYIVGGVDTRSFVAGYEQLSPQGKPAITASLDAAVFQQVLRHATDYGVSSPITDSTVSRATLPAQPAIRAALDKDIWELMESVHRQYSAQSLVLEAAARRASSARIGQILFSRLTGQPLPPRILEVPGQTV